MSGLAKSLVAAVLTLPLVAFVAGVLSAPEEPAPDRSRPVIIGNVDDDEPGKQADRQRRDRSDDGAGDGDADDDGDRDDDDGDRDDDDGDRPGPVTVVTPAPRDLGSDDDAVGDDEADDGDDESDDDSGGDD